MSRSDLAHSTSQQVLHDVLSNDNGLNVAPFTISKIISADDSSREQFSFAVKSLGRTHDISISGPCNVEAPELKSPCRVTISNRTVGASDEKAAQLFYKAKSLYDLHTSTVVAEIDRYRAELRDGVLPTKERTRDYPPQWTSIKPETPTTSHLKLEISIVPGESSEEKASLRAKIVGKRGKCRTEVTYEGAEAEELAFQVIGEDEILVTVAQLSGNLYEKVQMYLEQPPVYGGVDILPLLSLVRDFRAGAADSVRDSMRYLVVKAFADPEIVEAFTSLIGSADVCGQPPILDEDCPSHPKGGARAPISYADIVTMNDKEFLSLISNPIEVYRAFSGLISKRGAGEVVKEGLQWLRSFEGGKDFALLVQELEAAPIAGVCQLFESVYEGLSLTAQLPSRLPEGAIRNIILGDKNGNRFPVSSQTCQEAHTIVDAIVWVEEGVRPLCRPEIYINFLLAVNEIPGLREGFMDVLRSRFSTVAQ